MAKIIKHPKRTQAIIDFVDANYPNMSIEKMANHVGVSVTVIKNYMKEKGYPTTLFRYTTTFKKGQIPFNKGMKINPHPNSIATQFKKGCNTHNERLIGSIQHRRTKQGVLKFIKVENHKWILLSRYNWQNQYGEIPKDLVLFHKDGNSQNCEVDNLELITRKELRIRNAGSVKLTDAFVLHTITRNNQEKEVISNQFPDLIEVKRNVLKIKHHAKKRDNDHRSS